MSPVCAVVGGVLGQEVVKVKQKTSGSIERPYIKHVVRPLLFVPTLVKLPHVINYPKNCIDLQKTPHVALCFQNCLFVCYSRFLKVNSQKGIF